MTVGRLGTLQWARQRGWRCQVVLSAHATFPYLAVDESSVILLTLSLSPSLLIHLLKREGGAAEWQNSRQGPPVPGHAETAAQHRRVVEADGRVPALQVERAVAGVPSRAVGTGLARVADRGEVDGAADGVA